MGHTGTISLCFMFSSLCPIGEFQFGLFSSISNFFPVRQQVQMEHFLLVGQAMGMLMRYKKKEIKPCQIITLLLVYFLGIFQLFFIRISAVYLRFNRFFVVLELNFLSISTCFLISFENCGICWVLRRLSVPLKYQIFIHKL